MSLISILIPVKNAEKYLQECMESILNQSHNNFELIAINDHSTDRSLEILQYYALQDERVQVLNNAGKGIIEALRLAFSACKGNVITRMDADDRMHPNKLESMYGELEKQGSGNLVLGLVEYFSEAGIGNGYKRYAEWLNTLTRNQNNFADIYRECAIPSPCWMLYKDDLIACDAFNPNRYPEDYDLAFRFYKQGLNIIGVNSILHYWRDYPERSSRTDPNYLDNRFFDIKLSYFLKLEKEDKDSIVLYGAGKKAKYIAKALREKNLSFTWLTNNPKKIGKEVYGVLLQDQSQLIKREHQKIIIVVSNPKEQELIASKLLEMNNMLGKDYFFFT